jgi:uncharacterized protein YcgI (DUF1989 family)
MTASPAGKLLVDDPLPFNTGLAHTVRAGQYVRVVGRSTNDFVAFNLDNLSERFDQARTKSNQSKLFMSTGDVLVSKNNNNMLTIVEDTWPGRHDLQRGMCSRKRIEMVFNGQATRDRWGGGQQVEEKWEDLPSHGCWENLTEALKEWNVEADDIPAPFNIFQNTRIDGETGRMWWEAIPLDEDVHIHMRAEMDLLVATSNCPGGRGPTSRVQIYDR